LSSAVLGNAGCTATGEFPGLAPHTVLLEAGELKCVTCRGRRCVVGEVDILLLDGVPADGEEEQSVQRFVDAVKPRITICCQPYTERNALVTDPAAKSTVADSYGLPTSAQTLVTFTGSERCRDRRNVAQLCCNTFADAQCRGTVHPGTLLAAALPQLVRGAEADGDATLRRASDAAAVDEAVADRVFAAWKDRGWVTADSSREAYTAVLREPGAALKARCFADHAGKGSEATLRAAMLLRLRRDAPGWLGLASTGKSAPFHVDGTMPDLRDCKVNPVVAVDSDGARVLSFIEVMALRGYQPMLHNLATEPLGNRNALVAKAVPAPIWVKALLAAVAGLQFA